MHDAHTLLDALGQPVPGHLDARAGKGHPGVIVLHEYWGLNDQTKAFCGRLAEQGFVVFAPDLFGGRVATSPDEAMGLMKGLQREQVVHLVTRATAALKSVQLGARVGVMGFCMGGGLALYTASRIPGLNACVPFYGLPAAGEADYSAIRGRVQGHFAKVDDHVTPERVDAFEKDLQRMGVEHTLFRYDAQHAFMNEARPEVHDPRASAEAFDRAVAFLHAELDGHGPPPGAQR